MGFLGYFVKLIHIPMYVPHPLPTPDVATGVTAWLTRSCFPLDLIS